jgi:hypothetical protein
MAATLHSFLLEHSLDAAIVTDAGFIGPGCHEALSPEYRVYSTPSTLRWSCAIVVRSEYTVVKELHDNEGRALAIDIEHATGRGITTVISLYQPTDLDNDDNREGVKTAERLRKLVKRWRSRKRVEACLLGADVNETLISCLDRASHNGCIREQRHGVIHAMLEEDEWCDLYRELHPMSLEELAPSPDVKGHTYFHTKGSSRLDFLLAYPRPDLASCKCTPDLSCTLTRPIMPHGTQDSAYKGKNNQHIPLLFQAPAQKPLPRPPKIAAPTLNLDRLSDDSKTKMRSSFLTAMAGALPTLLHELEKLGVRDHRAAEATLARAHDTLRECFEGSTREHHRPSCTKGPKTDAHPAVTRLSKVKTALFNLRGAVNESLELKSADVYSHRAEKAVTQLERLGALTKWECSLERRPDWDDSAEWTSWLGRSGDVMASVRKRLTLLRRKSYYHPQNANDRYFKDAKGRGRFYRGLKLGWARSTPVSSAMSEEGEVVRDPKLYIPLVRSTVMQPFSVAKRAPAVPAWRLLSKREWRTGRPFWWIKYYARKLGINPDVLWNRPTAPCTLEEMFYTILDAPTGKSPGHDGIPMDLFKLLIGADRGATPPAPDLENPVLQFLTAFVNAALRTGCCPSSLKSGVIVMIPKPGKESDNAADMRPITLLPELGKLVARILAKRITRTLHEKPDLLCHAQRAYLLDGSSRQCLSAVLDIIDDFKEERKRDPDVELILTSYDVKKAFDSVHPFTIRASCERLNLPETFIRYVLDTLRGAVSRVRCNDGLTEPFDIRSSVRQGDPIAALLFIFVMDGLHAGLQRSPLGLADTGYLVSADTPESAEVHSVGYSDDTCMVSSTWAGAVAKHEWVREFFVAHHLRLNATKSVCVVGSCLDVSAPKTCSSGGKKDAARDPVESPRPAGQPTRFLKGIDEAQVHDPAHGLPAATHFSADAPMQPQSMSKHDIHTRDSAFAFKYLGFQVRIDGGNGLTVRAISFEIWKVCTTIRTNRLNPVQVGHLLREYLYPRIDLHLTFASIDLKQIRRWDALIRGSALHMGHDAATRSLCKEAFFLAAGVLPLELHASVIKANSTGTALRSDPAPCAPIAIARLATATARSRVRTEAPCEELANTGCELIRATKMSRSCRTTRALMHAQKLGHVLAEHKPLTVAQYRCHGTEIVNARQCPITRIPASVATLRLYCDCPGGPEHGVVAFTDGSFIRDHEQLGSVCGWAAVLIREEDYLDPNYQFEKGSYTVLRGAAPLAGANYAAEVKALLAVLHAVPVSTRLLCISDSLGALQVIWKPVMPNGARLRLGARSLVAPARRLLEIRSAHAETRKRHIHSHTGGTSADARGNSVADAEAKTAAMTSKPCGPAIATDEKYIFLEEKNSECFHVHGNLRASLKAAASAQSVKEWLSHPSQGLIPRHIGERSTVKLVRIVRKTCDATLLTFCVKALTLQLSTSSKMRYKEGRDLTTVMRKGIWSCRTCEITMKAAERKDHLRSEAHKQKSPPPPPPIADCPLCGVLQHNMHPFSCATSIPEVAASREYIQSRFRRLCRDVVRMDPPAVTTVHHSGIDELPNAHQLFNPPDMLEADPPKDAVKQFASTIGVFPPEVSRTVLDHEHFSEHEAAVKKLQKWFPEQLDHLRIEALREAAAIHNAWRRRVVASLNATGSPEKKRSRHDECSTTVYQAGRVTRAGGPAEPRSKRARKANTSTRHEKAGKARRKRMRPIPMSSYIRKPRLDPASRRQSQPAGTVLEPGDWTALPRTSPRLTVDLSLSPSDRDRLGHNEPP